MPVRRADGRCWACNEPAEAGKLYCETHRDRRGLCRSCSQPAVEGQHLCAMHRLRASIKAAQTKGARNDGRCLTCRNSADLGHVYCDTCHTAIQKRATRAFTIARYLRENAGFSLLDFFQTKYEKSPFVVEELQPHGPTPDTADDDPRAACVAWGASRGRYRWFQ